MVLNWLLNSLRLSLQTVFPTTQKGIPLSKDVKFPLGWKFDQFYLSPTQTAVKYKLPIATVYMYRCSSFWIHNLICGRYKLKEEEEGGNLWWVQGLLLFCSFYFRQWLGWDGAVDLCGEKITSTCSKTGFQEAQCHLQGLLHATTSSALLVRAGPRTLTILSYVHNTQIHTFSLPLTIYLFINLCRGSDGNQDHIYISEVSYFWIY